MRPGVREAVAKALWARAEAKMMGRMQIERIRIFGLPAGMIIGHKHNLDWGFGKQKVEEMSWK